MLKKEHVNFLLELLNNPQITVPVASARTAADAYDELMAQQKKFLDEATIKD